MSALIAFRIIKLLAVAALAAGSLGAGFAAEQRDRLAAAFWVATPAFLVTWIAGFAMAKAGGHSLGAPWIALAMATSLMGFHHAILACRKSGRRAPFAGLTAGWVTASIVAMVIRQPGAWFWGLTVGLGAAVGIAGWLVARSMEARRPGVETDPGPATLAWFTWMGRLEALSFLALLALVVVRRGAGIDLDPWRLVGMAHGALFIVYLQALASAARVTEWGRRELALGLLAAIVPGGPFVFEAKVTHRPTPTPAVP